MMKSFNRSKAMHTKLTSKYYLVRIAKSKDMIDLVDAIAAYNKFKQSRREYAIKHYCKSMKSRDIFGVFESFFIPAY
jgi:hypothetical protein